jgi:hypothetical protein
MNKSFWLGFVAAAIIILPTVVVLFYKLDQMFDLH